MNKVSASNAFKCIDHSVSKEVFWVKKDTRREMLYTELPKTAFDVLDYYENDNYISHSDASDAFWDKIYQQIKRFKIANKLKLYRQLKPNQGRLLDIGAGTADFILAAQNSGWQVFGSEPNRRARAKALEKGIHLSTSTKNLPNASFDIISMWHVLEHVVDLEAQLNELHRLIKPNGYVLIAVPNYKSFDAKHYGAYWAAYDVPRHVWHFSKSAIAELFKEKKMTLQAIKPMRWDAYYVALLSERYKHSKLQLLRAACIGFLSNAKAIQTKEYSALLYILKNESLA